jgi:AcrR family transcriptional regulator
VGEVRERILDAALRLLADDGVPSMGAVARAAGVSRATLYRRFACAEDLWAAVAAERAVRASRSGSPRQRILDAARHSFSSLGLHGTSVQLLAEQARVGFATIYAQFGDKEGVLVALIDTAPLSTLDAAVAATHLPLRDYLYRVVLTMIQTSRADAGLLLLLLGPEPAVQGAQQRLRARLEPSRRTLVAALADRVRRGTLSGEPSALAQSLISQAVAAGIWTPAAVEVAAEGILRGFVEGHGDNPAVGGGGGDGR